MMVGRLLSYWEGIFSGAMLNFGRVTSDFVLFCSAIPEGVKTTKMNFISSVQIYPRLPRHEFILLNTFI